MKTRTKNPNGGLTAAGRKMFRRRDGFKLRPGVKNHGKKMSASDLKRKGSWATRFYGRKGKLPPLVNAKGKPTRFALAAHAWGEPVPRTAAAARKIAERGRRLLKRYSRTKRSAA